MLCFLQLGAANSVCLRLEILGAAHTLSAPSLSDKN